MRPYKRKRSRKNTHARMLLLLVAAILVIYGAISESGIVSPAADPTVIPDLREGDWYALYFTDPTSPDSLSQRGGPDAHLAAAIRQARLSIDIAIYDLNLRSLRDALIDAHLRGAAVRVVSESDNLDRPEMQDLVDAGIPVLGDRRQGLMHNKFVVIDRHEVWTGSMNFTVNGAYRNDNNLLRIKSPRLAENYLVEFEEMFVHDRFGPGSPANTPYPTLSVAGVELEVYFSPEDGTAARLIELIKGAQETVHFLAFSFTSDDIAAALLERAQNGVTVSGVFEQSQYRSNIGTEYDNLRLAGLSVRLDGNPRNMHHKVMIIDRHTVVTGSYNFTSSAEKRNDENTLVIHDPQVATEFMAEYGRVFSISQP